jgi:hypothetical protein
MGYYFALLLALLLAFTVVVAQAQTSTFTNEKGQLTGTSSTSGNVTTYRDRMGRRIGTAEKLSNGAAIFRDG